MVKLNKLFLDELVHILTCFCIESFIWNYDMSFLHLHLTLWTISISLFWQVCLNILSINSKSRHWRQTFWGHCNKRESKHLKFHPEKLIKIRNLIIGYNCSLQSLFDPISVLGVVVFRYYCIYLIKLHSVI